MNNKTKVFLARNLRRKQTDAERKLWSKLRGNGIPGFKFRRQFPIKPYFADFCCVRSHLVFELDGSQHDQMEEADRMRTKYIEKHGYRVIRFWDNDVLMKTGAIMEAIYMKRSRTLTPALSHFVGEGVRGY